jgi:hypothetical protein
MEGTPGKVYTTIPGPIAPNGGSVTVDIVLDIDVGTEGLTLSNYAEIADDGAASGADIDSTPDDIDDEDPVRDDVLHEDGKQFNDQDEDDHDVAELLVDNKVGIGNLVFFDDNDNGVFDPDQGETGVDDVEVDLFAEGDDSSLDQPLATTITAGGGFYWFDELAAGRYFVHIPTREFLGGRPLERYRSSTGQGTDTGVDDDTDENGSDSGQPMTIGVSSTVIELTVGGEPVKELGALGNYAGVQPDASVNATVDFGFHEAAQALTCYDICDVDGSGSVTNADIISILRNRNAIINPPGADESGDCLPDGVITFNDAAACRAYR